MSCRHKKPEDEQPNRDYQEAIRVDMGRSDVSLNVRAFGTRRLRFGSGTKGVQFSFVLS